MPSNAKIRIIKRGQQPAQEVPAAAEQRTQAEPARTVKTVVSGWVREHQQRAAEFRNNYSALLEEVGFRAPGNCVRC
ncbi:MAG TPA: hypothetical protein VEY09_14245 [Pyrinomonadaceae bacterium]|nr:hypothetical protein [Pyrinomonadaceae bacterium]